MLEFLLLCRLAVLEVLGLYLGPSTHGGIVDCIFFLDVVRDGFVPHGVGCGIVGLVVFCCVAFQDLSSQHTQPEKLQVIAAT